MSSDYIHVVVQINVFFFFEEFRSMLLVHVVFDIFFYNLRILNIVECSYYYTFGCHVLVRSFGPPHDYSPGP